VIAGVEGVAGVAGKEVGVRGSVILLVSAMLVVAGCGSSASPSGPGPSLSTERPVSSVNAGSGADGLAFVVTASFTGTAAISGTFLDTYTGRGFSSCAAYATAPLWTSPGAVTGTERIGGLPVSFDFAMPPGQFSGPGHYAPGVMGRLSIGADTFSGMESWVTLRDDGSGSGWFSDFMLEGGGRPARPESGTVTWTCSE
jgi:hypothetical protein